MDVAEELQHAIDEMNKALTAIRLEVPKEIAEDVRKQWQNVLDYLKLYMEEDEQCQK